jgi:hypothetical protein
VVRQELLEGEPLDLLFKEFDPVPLGSASIAQVPPPPPLKPHTLPLRYPTLPYPRREAQEQVLCCVLVPSPSQTRHPPLKPYPNPSGILCLDVCSCALPLPNATPYPTPILS